MASRKEITTIFMLLIGVLLLGFSYFNYLNNKLNKNDYKKFNVDLNNKEQAAYKGIKAIKFLNKANCFKYFHKHKEQFENEGLSYFIFEGSYLSCWSNNSQITSDDFELFKNKTGVIKLENGIYQYVKDLSFERTIISLIKIQNQFSIQNEYLVNNYSKGFSLSNSNIITLNTSGKNIINAIDTTPLFSIIDLDDNEEESSPFLKITIVLAFCLISLGLFNFIDALPIKKSISLILNILSVSVLNYTLFTYSIIPLDSGISFWLLITLNILFLILLLIKSSKISNGFLFFQIPLSITLSIFVHQLILKTFYNKSFNIIDFNYHSINLFSIIGVTCLILILILNFLWIKEIIELLRLKKKNKWLITYNLATLFAFIAAAIVFNISFYIVGIFIIITLVFSTTTLSKKTLLSSFLIILGTVTVLTIEWIPLYKTIPAEKNIVLCETISQEKDKYAESLFKKTILPIVQDSLLNNLYKNYWENKTIFDRHLQENYFNGYWQKFEQKYYLFNSQDSIFINNDSNYVNGLNYVDSLIKSQPNKGDNDFWYLIKTKEGFSKNLAKVPFGSDNEHYLFIEFLPKTHISLKGYPELLIDSKKRSLYPKDVFFAKYSNNRLISSTKGFEYPLQFKLNKPIETYPYYEKLDFEGFQHFAYAKNENLLILISKKKTSYLQKVSLLSYLLILCLFLNYLLNIAVSLVKGEYTLKFRSLSHKIQRFIISLTCVALILVGIGTSYYTYQQAEKNNFNLIKEKMESITLELQYKVSEAFSQNMNSYNYLNRYLIKFSKVFNTDINLYNLNGELITTSRAKIFNNGLKSTLMSSGAFYQLNFLEKPVLVQKESIGSLSYISGYQPLRNEEDEIIAYLNVPFFTKQKELKEELVSLYNLLINSYSLIFIFTIVAILIFSNKLSKPLRLIKKELINLKLLNKGNKKLEWDSDDEIGAVIKAYNEKVSELEASVQKLALNERESAWREMAKQIAHEVKNPLTPMKLSIQHLKKIATEKPSLIKEKIDITANSLIKQIDALSLISSEFSNFANTTEIKTSYIDTVPLIKGVAYLFKNKNITVNVDLHSKEIILNVNSEKLLSIFNNLIKNAKQAIPEGKKGIISIKSFVAENRVVISVSDNGKGIDEEKKEFVFQPKFTTKSDGSGLGLAIIKNTLSNWNGRIWFESDNKKGSTFFISFPKV